MGMISNNKIITAVIITIVKVTVLKVVLPNDHGALLCVRQYYSLRDDLKAPTQLLRLYS